MEKTKLDTLVVKPATTFVENEITFRFLDEVIENNIDTKINNIQSFIENNHGLGKSELEQDNLYGTAKNTWTELKELFINNKYNIWLNRKEYNLLTTLLLVKMEYDVDNLFTAIRLEKTLAQWHNNKYKYSNDTENKSYAADTRDIIDIYHLLLTHKVKGLTNETYTYVAILNKIGFIHKYISYVDAELKYYLTDIADWTSTFDEGVYIEGKKHGRKEFAALQAARALESEAKTETKKSHKKQTTITESNI
jgi:hypothetical protein